MPENIEAVPAQTKNNMKAVDDHPLSSSAEGTGHRPRKKNFHDQILRQLEFYLGDANLSKDRFLTKKLEENPQLPVDIFLTFNKIRSFTSDVKDLLIALRKSTLLELTEDETKVFRKTQVQKRGNQEDCTIYVENLPSEANHDWLTKIFVNYGNVLYVSIPKFRNSRQNKGFAFIEFDSPECVTKVLEAFGAAGCRLSASMPSDQLLSIKTFEEDEGKSLYHNTEENVDEKAQETKPSTEDKSDANKSLGKRKHLSADEEQEEAKKAKQDVTDTSESATKPSSEIKEEDKPKEISVQVESFNPGNLLMKVPENMDVQEAAGASLTLAKGGSDVSSDDEASVDDKNKNKKNKKVNLKHQLEVSSLGLQVLSKCEWRRLRNKYLNLQRDKMAALKKQARMLALEDQQRKMAEAEKKEQKSEPSESNGKEVADYTFIPGAIIKHDPDNFIEDVVKFKRDAREIKGVAYIDIAVGRKEVFIRCESAEVANRLLESKVWTNCSLLAGEEEKTYWDKIAEFRAAKFNKQRDKVRGRNKIFNRIKKLNMDQSSTPTDKTLTSNPTTVLKDSGVGPKQHIRFGDDDEVKPEPSSTETTTETKQTETQEENVAKPVELEVKKED